MVDGAPKGGGSFVDRLDDRLQGGRVSGNPLRRRHTPRTKLAAAPRPSRIRPAPGQPGSGSSAFATARLAGAAGAGPGPRASLEGSRRTVIAGLGGTAPRASFPTSPARAGRRPGLPALRRPPTTSETTSKQPFPQFGKYFHLTDRKTRFSREIRAGIVTFLTAW
jgi:hypothetical protein